jgi:hypothetical protein
MKNIEVQINKEEFKKKLGIPPVDVPEVVRNKLELLRGEERLDKSAIRGLDDYEEVKKKAFARQPISYSGRGGGTSSSSSTTTASNWNVNKEFIGSGETLAIVSRYQLVIGDEFEVENGGELVCDGELLVL